jgi:hypothetical protein
MRLYFFRSTSDIPVEDMVEVAERVSRVFGIDFSVFTGPVSCSAEASVEDFLLISDRFLERGEPVVTIVFTRNGIQEDEAILGQGSEPNRGAWVRWSDRLEQVITATIHELGHVCEADHCVNESCVMYPVYREHKGTSMKEWFCERCLAIIQSSWVYNRLKQASEDRARKGKRLPKIVNSRRAEIVANPSAGPRPSEGRVSTEAPSPFLPPFPDWELAKENREEFIRRVMEHFGYEED